MMLATISEEILNKLAEAESEEEVLNILKENNEVFWHWETKTITAAPADPYPQRDRCRCRHACAGDRADHPDPWEVR